MRRSARIIAAPLVSPPPALADPIARTSPAADQFVIRSGVGGSYDSYSRLLARHIGKHIPGNPSILTVNMPGGGGIRAANYVAKIAPQDGTILTIVSQGLAVDQGLGLNPSFQADLRAFNWVGNVIASNQVLVTWHTSPTKPRRPDAARDRDRPEPGRPISVQMPAVLNIVGTKIKIVYGYPDGRDINSRWSAVRSRAAPPIHGRATSRPTRSMSTMKIIPIIQIGMQKESQPPDVPLMRPRQERARSAVLDFMSKAVVRPPDRDHTGRAGRVVAARRA
jgi:hypothetical protein